MSCEPLFRLAGAPNTERGFPAHLDCHPNEEKIVYGSGNNVFVRNYDSTICMMYNKHAAKVNSAKFNENGAYVLSGDNSGHVHLWGPYNQLPTEMSCQPGTSSVSEVAIGMKNKFGVASRTISGGITAHHDKGNFSGEIIGNTGIPRCVDMTKGRPPRIVSGDDSGRIVLAKGLPFAFEKSVNVHTKPVNLVRFAEDRKSILTLGSDGKATILSVPDLEIIVEKQICKGSLYSGCFYNDKIIVGGLDKVLRVLDLELNILGEVSLSSRRDHIISGITMHGTDIIVNTLSKDLFIIDFDELLIKRVLYGHGKEVICLSKVDDSRLLSMSGDYVLLLSEVKDNEIKPLKRYFTPSLDVSFSSMYFRNGFVYAGTKTGGVYIFDINSDEIGEPIEIGAEIRDIVTTDAYCILCTGLGVFTLNLEIKEVKKTTIKGISCTLHANSNIYFAHDNVVQEFEFVHGDFAPLEEITFENAINKIRISPFGTKLGVVGYDRMVAVYHFDTKTIQNRAFGFHISQVLNLDWFEDNNRFITSGFNGKVFVWNCEEDSKRIEIAAHSGSANDCLVFNNTVISGGFDNSIRLFGCN
eukprot:TRINITY_DN997_c0_g2_i1.p1 TRINITY_DN997_c0_g2~~TRINITY_DN997_c0_g2_i1.p1  ORF type:complete len:583 (+),score=171.73 TRINITY_DN997_c0_g2_i1:149-1897(+)